MEVGETVLSLDFINAELDLAEGMVFVVLEIRERDFENAALQGVVRILKTAGTVDKGLPDAFRISVSSFPTVKCHEKSSASIQLTLGSGRSREPNRC